MQHDEEEFWGQIKPSAMPNLTQYDFVEAIHPAKGDEVESKCDTVTFYNHSTHPSPRRAKWSEFEDLVAEERRIKELGKGYAVIIRRSKIERNGYDAWETHSIEAQSPRLRKFLDEVFSGYVSWYPDAMPYAVAPPFKPYVHRWEKLLELAQQLDPKTADELKLLRGELEQPISSYLSILGRIRTTGTVTFRDLWIILAPGCLMVSSKGGNIYVSTLVKVDFFKGDQQNPPYYTIKLARVDWNGSYCGLEVYEEVINKYDDDSFITKLQTYPLEFTPEAMKTKEMLQERGRKFESLRGFHIKTCTGKKYVRHYNMSGDCIAEVEKPVSQRRCQNDRAMTRLTTRNHRFLGAS